MISWVMGAPAKVGAGAIVNGHMMKLLVAVDSFLAPVALGRNTVFVVGMLS